MTARKENTAAHGRQLANKGNGIDSYQIVKCRNDPSPLSRAED